jgi:hypothetical protein
MKSDLVARIDAFRGWADEVSTVGDDALSGHWEHFSARQDVDPGAGFDRDWAALNVPGLHPSILRAIKSETASRLATAFETVWPSGSPVELASVQRIRNRYVPIALSAAHAANTVITALADEFEESTCNDVVEIGAGSGYLSHHLLQHFEPRRLIIVDLPNVIPYCAANIVRLNPNITISLPNEVDDATDKWGRIVFLVPGQKNCVPENSINLFVNTASMQEMLPSVIEDYFHWIRSRQAKDRSFFYCANRVEKWMSLENGSSDSPSSQQDIPVRFSEYPWDESEDDLLYRVSRYHRLISAEPVQERIVRLY